ncbi:MAG: decarboxylase [Lachnospiraceae bacterium]|nr:decarboxylase [Lachnospiraceae bacterium]
METLFEQLRGYGRSEIYPYHMPGHKRRGLGDMPGSLAKLDITEVEGFDNLHQPEGILEEMQKYAAAAYGAEESYYLVGGSTCGILSAVSAAIPREGRLLIARNCHKSVFHAAYLRGLQLSYLDPGQVPEVGIPEAVTARQVQEALEREQGIQGILIVSPTYEGRIAEVEEIARIAHGYGIPLIVDEAHGAHLGFYPGFAGGSSRAGADLVVTSVHKTLPAMTQTALLHANGTLVDRRMLRRFLRIYQSSSPSYVLMASIDNAIRLAREKVDLFRQMTMNWNRMLEKLSKCRALTVWPPASLPQAEYQRHQDMGKLVISVQGTGITGQELYRELLENYGLQLEMACHSYVLAMFTIADTVQGYERLTKALLDMDSRIGRPESRRYFQAESGCLASIPTDGIPELGEDVQRSAKTAGEPAPPGSRKGMRLSECWDLPVEWAVLADAVGRSVGEFVSIYPPGTPMLVPGERLEKADLERILQYLADGLQVQGISVKEGRPGLMVLSEQT